ncbi:MAG TPA: hypothetical protein VHW01_07220, partial [Polyangiaceae bacterium]|nr:hypothetical protein [Polyangiaceae bacterium]
MNRLNWCFGVVSVLVAASACSSKSDGNGVAPIAQAGAGGMATGGSGATAGAASGSGGAATGGSTSGGSTAGGTGGAGGATGPVPTEVTHIDACGYMALTISKGVIYFTDSAHGNVKSVPVAGGTATDVATGQKGPYAVAVDDAGVVYWSNTSATVGTDNTLMMKAPGGMPTLITAVDQTTAKPGATNMVKSITLDGKGNLYYGDNDDLDKVAAMAASTPTKVGTFEGQPIAITLSPAAPAATTRIFTALALDNAVQWRNPDPALSGCADPVARPVGNTTTGGCAFSESIPDLV